jgi:hypothetical protein
MHIHKSSHAILGLLVLVPEFGLAESRSCDSEADDRAIAIAEAILIHDKSIRALEWDGSIFMILNDAPELIRDGSFGEDDCGRWHWDGRHAFVFPDKPKEWSHVHYRCDGSQEVAVTDETSAARLSAPSEMRRYYPSPLHNLGRWIDLQGTCRLGELLLQSSDLRVVPYADRDAFGREKWLTIVGSVFLKHGPARLEVTVDPEHGFCPRVIRRYDEFFDVLSEELTVDRVECIDGIWIPVEGSRSVYSKLPIDPDHSDAIWAEALERGARADLVGSDWTCVRAHASAVRHVLGADGYPTKPMGPTWTFAVSRVHSVNHVLPEASFRFDYPDQMLVFDDRTGVRFVSMHGVLVPIEDDTDDPQDSSEPVGDAEGGGVQ